jgi:hypothetical protein
VAKVAPLELPAAVPTKTVPESPASPSESEKKTERKPNKMEINTDVLDRQFEEKREIIK